MQIMKITERIDYLIELADKALATEHTNKYGDKFISEEVFNEFRSSSLSFIKNVYGMDHPYFNEFERDTKNPDSYETRQGKGILKAIKQEIDDGWIYSFKGLVSAEIFSDFLEMAEYLLNENYKDSAAVMIGSVLEEHLRQLCIKNEIPITQIKDSKEVPLKVDLLNSELVKADVYNKLDQKSVTSWLDLRNKAAHGKYTEYLKEQVELMYHAVTDFIVRNP